MPDSIVLYNSRTGGSTQAISFINSFRDGVKVGDMPFTTNWQEISGMAYATHPSNSTHLWAMADGSVDLLLAFSDNGVSVSTAEWTLTGINGVDYESLASARIGTTSYLYLADIGDNSNNRGSVIIYRIKEPALVGTAGVIASADIEQIVCTYASTGSHKDAECLLVDPQVGDMYIITKRINPPFCYQLTHQAAYVGTQSLVFMGSIANIPISNNFNAQNTGNVVDGSINPNGNEILLKNYTDVYYFARNTASETIFVALTGALATVPAYVGGGRPSSLWNLEPQGEAITFDKAGRHFYTASESGTADQTGAASNNFPLRQYIRLASAFSTRVLQEGSNGVLGSYDTFIWQTSGTTAFGTTATFIVDSDAPTDERYGLLRFDHTYLPYDCTVVGCDLDLFINTEGQDFDFYRVLTGWVESVTYNTFQAGSGLTTDGVVASINADVIHGAPNSVAANHGYNGITGNVKSKIPISTIQGFVSAPNVNYGWGFINTGSSLDGFQFRTKEHPTGTSHPLWTVRYQGGFMPADVSGLSRWWSGQYAIGETVVSNNAAVSTWPDRSSVNNDASMALAGSQPTYVFAESNARSTLLFNGTSQFMNMTALSMAAWTIVFVPNIVLSANSGEIIVADSTAGLEAIEFAMPSSTLVLNANAFGTARQWLTSSASGYHVHVVRSDFKYWINGVEQATTGNSVGTDPTLTINSIGYDSFYFLNGHLGDLAIWNKSLSTSELNQVGRYFSWAHNKTWTTVS